MTDTVWWQHGIIYQVYPRSFQDSNGDGIGDLAGIERRLDYLHWLGVDAIWISPIFPSPMADFGYDITDYCGIDPIFGTLGDFERLLAAGACARAESHPGPRSEPHIGSPPVVSGEPLLPRQSKARLVHLARSGRGWRAAKQLAGEFRRQRLGI